MEIAHAAEHRVLSKTMPTPSRLVLFLSIILAAPAGLLAQDDPASLSAVVTAYDTGEPLTGATISIDEGQYGALTDGRGRAYIVGIAPGTHLVEVTAFGYRPERVTVEFAAGGAVEAELGLLIGPIQLEPLNVIAAAMERRLEIKGFYDRQKHYAHGTFLTPERIADEARRGARFVDLFRQVRGISVVVSTGATSTGYTLMSSRGSGLRARCSPAIFLNGVRYQVLDPTEVENLVPLAMVAGVEVYAGPTSPVRYTGYSPCGAILIWTK